VFKKTSPVGYRPHNLDPSCKMPSRILIQFDDRSWRDELWPKAGVEIDDKADYYSGSEAPEVFITPLWLPYLVVAFQSWWYAHSMRTFQGPCSFGRNEHEPNKPNKLKPKLFGKSACVGSNSESSIWVVGLDEIDWVQGRLSFNPRSCHIQLQSLHIHLYPSPPWKTPVSSSSTSHALP
jgi:hypothetical protein